MSKAQILDQLIEVFRDYGYEGTTLTRLSQATGLGKASLYHHFPGGKEQMAAAVLERIQQGLEAMILNPLQQPGTPAARVRAMARVVAQFYDQGHAGCLLATMSAGQANDLFHGQVHKIFELWITALAQVAQEAGLDPQAARDWAEDVILQIQGALILARGLGNSTAFQRVIQRLDVGLPQ